MPKYLMQHGYNVIVIKALIAKALRRKPYAFIFTFLSLRLFTVDKQFPSVNNIT